MQAVGGDDFYAGTPAVTAHEVGEGCAVFVGTALDEVGIDALFDDMLRTAGVATIDAPEDVEVASRVGDDGTVYTIVTNTGDARRVWERADGERIVLDPFAVLLFENDVQVATPQR